MLRQWTEKRGENLENNVHGDKYPLRFDFSSYRIDRFISTLFHVPGSIEFTNRFMKLSMYLTSERTGVIRREGSEGYYWYILRQWYHLCWCFTYYSLGQYHCGRIVGYGTGGRVYVWGRRDNSVPLLLFVHKIYINENSKDYNGGRLPIFILKL